MKQTIKLTESELREMIVNAINESMEEGENEVFDKTRQKIKNAYNQMSTGLKTAKKMPINYHADPNAKDALSQGISNIGQRIGNFKKGYNMQAQYKHMDDLKNELQQLVNNGTLYPKQSLEQLLTSSTRSSQNKNRGSIGFDGVKSELQTQSAKLVHTKNGIIRKDLEEAINRVIDEFLNEQNKKEV